MGKVLQAIRKWRFPRLSVATLRTHLRGKMRVLLAVAAALVLGSTIGGLAMVMAGGDGAPEVPKSIYVGDLERMARPFERAEQPDELAEQTELSDNEVVTALPPAEAQPVAGDSLPQAEVDAAQSLPVAPQQSLPNPDRLFGVDTQGPLPPGLETLATGAPPANADSTLLEPGIGGRLPIVAEDGRTPLTTYARPASATNLPKIAIIVQDLGLNPKLTADSTQLPPEITLGFSPYMAHGGAWHRYARGHGHETVLSLPVTFPPSSLRDEGPLSIDPGFDDTELMTSLKRVLVRGEGYIALVAQSGRFQSQPQRFGPIAQELSARGLGFVELGDPVITATTPAPGLNYAHASINLDRVLTPQGIEDQLRILERLAEVQGYAIAYTRPYPLVFDRIWQWANALDRNRIALVPLSSLLKENAS